MINNFKITIEYDGSLYHGWQRQKNDRTLQEGIEKVVLTISERLTSPPLIYAMLIAIEFTLNQMRTQIFDKSFIRIGRV